MAPPGRIALSPLYPLGHVPRSTHSTHLLISCLSQPKRQFQSWGPVGRSKTGTSPGPSTERGTQRASHKHSSKQQAALKRSECSPLAKLPTWAAGYVCRACFWWPPPGTRQKFRPFLPLTLGLVLNVFPLPASSLLFLVSPMTPMCLSAGIILTNPFTHFAQKSALQPAALLQPNLCRVMPARERPKSWPGVQLPKGEGLLPPLALTTSQPLAGVLCTSLTLAFRDQSRSPGRPVGEALIWKTICQGAPGWRNAAEGTWS